MTKKKWMNLYDINMDAFVWCIRNNFKVYPVTENNEDYKVVVEFEGGSHKFPQMYTKKTISRAVSDMYCKIYEQKSK